MPHIKHHAELIRKMVEHHANNINGKDMIQAVDNVIKQDSQVEKIVPKSREEATVHTHPFGKQK